MEGYKILLGWDGGCSIDGQHYTEKVVPYDGIFWSTKVENNFKSVKRKGNFPTCLKRVSDGMMLSTNVTVLPSAEQIEIQNRYKQTINEANKIIAANLVKKQTYLDELKSKLKLKDDDRVLLYGDGACEFSSIYNLNRSMAEIEKKRAEVKKYCADTPIVLTKIEFPSEPTDTAKTEFEKMKRIQDLIYNNTELLHSLVTHLGNVCKNDEYRKSAFREAGLDFNSIKTESNDPTEDAN
jgi:hypothetical protein